MPPSLLSIPRELRDLIIKYVLNLPRQPPDGPFYPSNRVEIRDYDSISTRRHFVRYEKLPEWTLPAALALLLVNHQIAAETREILTRLPIVYSLDLMMIGHYTCWPTWLSIPIASRHVDELTVTLRVFGSAKSESQHRTLFSDSPCRDGYPPSLISVLYSVLERTLKRGPFFPSRKSLTSWTAGIPGGVEFQTAILSAIECIVSTGEESRSYSERLWKEYGRVLIALDKQWTDKSIVIGTLLLDLQSPSSWQGQSVAEPEIGFSEWRTRAFYTFHAQSNTAVGPAQVPVARPEWLASYISSEIKILLRLCYSLNCSCATLFYERIGSIQVRVDGTLVSEIALDSMLAELQVTDPVNVIEEFEPMEKRELAFRAWKKRTLGLRRENGLPVVDPEDLLGETE